MHINIYVVSAYAYNKQKKTYVVMLGIHFHLKLQKLTSLSWNAQ